MRPTVADLRQSARDTATSARESAHSAAQKAAKRIQGVRKLEPDQVKLTRRLTLAFTLIPLIAVVVAIVNLWGTGISGTDLGLFLGFYVLTGLGITVGYHRFFTHLSFQAPRPVKVFWALAGSMALQGSIIDWVATHRRHHAYSDELGDPHSPHLVEQPGVKGVLQGLWHAHLGWFFAPERTSHERWAPDLLEDPDLVWIEKHFPAITVASFVLPALLGLVITQSLVGMLTAFLWGSLVRIFLLHHVTWSINSICHFYGTRPFLSRDESRNNVFLSLLSFGESWHNAHHAFPTSARHGLRWWEIDLSWIVIKVMSWVRLARDIKLPTARQLGRKTAAV